MKTDVIVIEENAQESIQVWLDAHPTATINHIIGTPADGRPIIIIYTEK